MIAPNDDAVEALKERAGGLPRLAVAARPALCVHCGAAPGPCCPRCFNALELRRRVREGFLAVDCPACAAPAFFDCEGALLPGGVHAARIALALRRPS